MSNRPQKVKIGAYTISIGTLSPTFDAEANGAFNEGAQRIDVSENLPTRQFVAEVLLHEILHAIWWERGLPPESEETTVIHMSRGVAQLIRDNPELIKWLLRQMTS